MNTAHYQTALMAQMTLPSTGEGKVAPEWIHLLPAPADGLVQTGDARGPYTMAPFAEIIENSFADRDALEIDINHATFLSAPKGGDARAVGWIKEMQARDDGLWGRVEWTDEGASLVTSKAYRGISPVVLHPTETDKRISRLANASLVNRPNLQGLTQLHQQETSMSFMQRLAKLLGLKEDATEEDVAAAVQKALKPAEEQVALQSSMTSIGEALGVKGGDAAAVLAAAQAAASGAAVPTEVIALQSEISSLTTKLNSLTEGGARDKATAYVDGEIKRGRAGVKPMRDRYIAMHMKDAVETAALIEAMPVLTGSGPALTPPSLDGVLSLNAEQMNVARQLGMTTEAYQAALKADQAEENV